MTPADPAGNLRPQQIVAARALAMTGHSGEAAAQARVSERTLRRWGTEPAFAAAVRAESRTIGSEATSALLAAQGEAVRVLRAAMRDAHSPATRVRAAVAVLSIGQQVAADDLDHRLDALERRANGPSSRPAQSYGRS